MAKSKGYVQPEFIVKDLSKSEIERGLKKLSKRKEEVQVLTSVTYDSQEIDNAISNLVATISEVFGEKSRELDENRYHQIWKGPHIIGMSESGKQSSFQNGIPDTIKLIEGLQKRLEEKLEDFESDEPRVFANKLEGLSIHKRILQAALPLFKDGHYANSVFEASKVLVNMVKEKSNRTDKDGNALMFSEMSGKDPNILFNDNKTQSEIDEQSGLSYLFSGAVLALRNPRGHDAWIDSADEAIEYIMFLSMLAKRIESATRRPDK